MKSFFALVAAGCVGLLAHAAPKTPPAVPPVDPSGDPITMPSATEKFDFAKIFRDKLVTADGKKGDAAKFAKAKYKVVYFSAHWCAPCRMFTPELVKFVNENRKGDNMEVVLVSRDKDKAAMLEYMKGEKMPWSGVVESELGKQAFAAGVTGIPRVRVFDAEGRLIMESKQIGREELLVALKAKLAALPASSKK